MRFPLPSGAEVSLRPVSAADNEFLLKVYADTRKDELAQVPWSDEQKSQFLKSQFDFQRQHYEANYPAIEYDVILVDEQPAGRIWISRGAEIHLLDIALLGEFQNRGVGTVLLRGLIDEAVRVQKPLRHTVFVLNTQAKQFYERLGFVVFGEAGAYLHMEWRGPRIDD
jgi:GNAT superfamily N-acetyltransferase